MSVEDELHWARGHVDRLAQSREGPADEHIGGALHHLLLALQELVSEVGAIKAPRRREVGDLAGQNLDEATGSDPKAAPDG